MLQVPVLMLQVQVLVLQPLLMPMLQPVSRKEFFHKLTTLVTLRKSASYENGTASSKLNESKAVAEIFSVTVSFTNSPAAKIFFITAEFAKQFAKSEFEKYRVIQDRLFSSDFDKFEDDGLKVVSAWQLTTNLPHLLRYGNQRVTRLAWQVAS